MALLSLWVDLDAAGGERCCGLSKLVDMMPCMVAEKGEKLKLEAVLAECWYGWPDPGVLS